MMRIRVTIFQNLPLSLSSFDHLLIEAIAAKNINVLIIIYTPFYNLSFLPNHKGGDISVNSVRLLECFRPKLSFCLCCRDAFPGAAFWQPLTQVAPGYVNSHTLTAARTCLLANRFNAIR